MRCLQDSRNSLKAQIGDSLFAFFCAHYIALFPHEFNPLESNVAVLGLADTWRVALRRSTWFTSVAMTVQNLVIRRTFSCWRGTESTLKRSLIPIIKA